MFETKRLYVREAVMTDWPLILNLLNSEGWLQFIGDRNVWDQATAEAYIRNNLQKSYTAYGYGLWVVELLGDRAKIGLCGLLRREHLQHPDLGFAVLPAYQRQGYTHEAARGVLNFVREKYPSGKIYGITTPENLNSRNLLLKLGMEPAGETSLGEKKNLLLFAIHIGDDD